MDGRTTRFVGTINWKAVDPIAFNSTQWKPVGWLWYRWPVVYRLTRYCWGPARHTLNSFSGKHHRKKAISLSMVNTKWILIPFKFFVILDKTLDSFSVRHPYICSWDPDLLFLNWNCSHLSVYIYILCLGNTTINSLHTPVERLTCLCIPYKSVIMEKYRNL